MRAPPYGALRPAEDAARFFARGRSALKETDSLLLFAGSSILYSGLSLMSGLIILRWIQPSVMGVWQTLIVIQTYLLVLRLGVLNGLNRDLPYLLGRGESASAMLFASVALGFGLLASAVSATGFGAAVVVLWERGPVWRAGLAAISATTITSFYQHYVISACRSATEFRRLATLQFGQAALVTTAPLAVWLWGFPGLAVQYVVQGAAATIWAHFIRPIRVRPQLHWESIRRLLRTGFPLFITSYLFTAALGFDRIILFAVGGTTAVGMYTPAAWVLAAMTVVPNALSAYVYPRMSFRLGQMEDPRALWSLTRAVIGASFAFLLPVVVCGWAVIPWVVRSAFPEYLPAVPAMKLTLLSGWLLMGPIPGTAVLRSLRAWRLLVAYVGIHAAARGLLPWYFSRGGDLITGVAMGCTIASGVTSAVAIWACYRATRGQVQSTRPGPVSPFAEKV